LRLSYLVCLSAACLPVLSVNGPGWSVRFSLGWVGVDLYEFERLRVGIVFALVWEPELGPGDEEREWEGVVELS
jgi:hypothetical protein